MRGDYRALFLLLATAAGYLTYVAVAMPASLNLEGDCLYTFWAPEPTPSLNPFWLFVYLVGLLFGLAMLLAVLGWKQDRSLNMFAGLFLLIVLGLWASDLGDLWDAIQTGREAVLAMPLAESGCKN